MWRLAIWKQLVYSHILEAVSSSPKAGFLMVGYDDLYAIQYFKDNRMAYWKHNGKKNIRQAFEESAKEYRSVMERCRHFDTRLMEDAEKAGGKDMQNFVPLLTARRWRPTNL